MTPKEKRLLAWYIIYEMVFSMIFLIVLLDEGTSEESLFKVPFYYILVFFFFSFLPIGVYFVVNLFKEASQSKKNDMKQIDSSTYQNQEEIDSHRNKNIPHKY